jgi:hypothetical protein
MSRHLGMHRPTAGGGTKAPRRGCTKAPNRGQIFIVLQLLNLGPIRVGATILSRRTRRFAGACNRRRARAATTNTQPGDRQPNRRHRRIARHPRDNRAASRHHPPFYRLQTKQGITAFKTSEEWLACWAKIVRRCKAANALDKLQTTRDTNEAHIASLVFSGADGGPKIFRT